MLFLNLSFVGTYALREALVGNADNVIITQAVPSLDSKTSPIVKEHIAALNAFDSDLQPNFVSLEGFIVAKIFHQGLLNIAGEITKESIVDGIEAMQGVDIGLDQKIYYDESDHQAIHKVWLTCLCHGVLNQFDWNVLQIQNNMDIEW